MFHMQLLRSCTKTDGVLEEFVCVEERGTSSASNTVNCAPLPLAARRVAQCIAKAQSTLSLEK